MIDFHTHPVQVADLFDDDPTLTRAVQEVFGLWMSPQPLRTYELHIEEAGADKAVAVPLDCTTAHGMTVVSNEQIARLMELTDKAIGFASVDPRDPGAPARSSTTRSTSTASRASSSTRRCSSSTSPTPTPPSRSTRRRRSWGSRC